jgi:Lon protease-like protein
MGRELEEMPLFPVNAVLFPYSTIHLHVFEPRYLDLVRYCLEYDSPFGIVLIREGEEVGGPADPYLVGTAVRIETVHQLEQGRIDLRLRGERRFRIREFVDGRPYSVGRVETVVEMEIEETPENLGLVQTFRSEFESFIKARFSQQDFNIKVTFNDDPQLLSFLVASFLQIPNLERQRLLETTDTIDRIELIMPHLTNMILDDRAPVTYKLAGPDRSEWIQPN